MKIVKQTFNKWKTSILFFHFSKNRRPESIVGGGDEKEKQLAEKDAEVRDIKQTMIFISNIFTDSKSAISW